MTTDGASGPAPGSASVMAGPDHDDSPTIDRPSDPAAGGDAVADLIKKLVWQTLPFSDATSVLQWAALAGEPRQSTTAIAELHGITVPVLGYRIRRVRRTASRLQLPPVVLAEASRRTRGGEDHETRTRQARLLDCPPPQPPPGPVLTQGRWRTARRAAEILGALGPLSIQDLTGCLQRIEDRAHRHITPRDVTIVLLTSGWATPGPDDRWTATADIPAPAKYVALLQAAQASGRDQHTLEQMLELLRRAGHTRATAATTTYHPLLQHPDYGRWVVRRPHRQSGSGSTSGSCASDAAVRM